MKTITPRCAAAAKTAQQGWLTWRHETKCVVYKVVTTAAVAPTAKPTPRPSQAPPVR